jgi:hypothetical protein
MTSSSPTSILELGLRTVKPAFPEPRTMFVETSRKMRFSSHHRYFEIRS